MRICLLIAAFRYHYEIVCDQTGTANRLYDLESAKRNQAQLTAAIELCDGMETELLLCYNRKLDVKFLIFIQKRCRVSNQTVYRLRLDKYSEVSTYHEDSKVSTIHTDLQSCYFE